MRAEYPIHPGANNICIVCVCVCVCVYYNIYFILKRYKRVFSIVTISTNI